MSSAGLTNPLSGSTGFDVASFVSQIIYAERTPARGWETQRTQLDAKATVARDINSKLLDLKSKVNALRDAGGKFNTRKAQTSNAEVVTVSVAANALATSHSIVVSNLATTSSHYSNQLASSSTAIASGTFNLQVGSGTTTAITVDSSNNTLDNLAAHINGLDLGVNASVITDANGARLSLVSETSGAAGQVTISGNTSGLTFTQASAGANANLTVNGVPISSATNTVDSAVAGVTLNLVGISATAVTVSISQDADKAKEAVNEFVTSYNAVIQAVNVQFTAASLGGTTSVPPMFADSSLRLVQEQITSSITFSGAGTNGVNDLGSLGISMQNNGTLTVDSAKLEELLAGNFEDVQNLFQATSGFGDTLHSKLESMTDSLNGTLNLSLKGIADTQASLTKQIEAFDVRIDMRREALYAQFNRVDGMLRQLPTLIASVQAQIGSLR